VREALRDDRQALARAGEMLPGAEDCTVAIVKDLSDFRLLFPDMRPPLPVRMTRIVLMAAHAALADSGIPLDGRREDTGIVFNRDRGTLSVVARIVEPVLTDGLRKMSPLLFPQSVANLPLGAVATSFGLHGPQLVTMGGAAFLLAVEMLRRGDATAMLCGGFEEVDINSFVAADANGIIQPHAPPAAYRPYHPQSPGAAYGEGAVFCMLEDAESAGVGRHRYAEIVAVAEGLDAAVDELTVADLRNWGRPRGEALADICRDALAGAGVSAGDIGLWVGGANGVPEYAAAEGVLICRSTV
jgi:3-oxoacyl-[acyl-carrier-protein] synthase II